MMKRTNVLAVVVCLLSGWQAFAQSSTTAKLKSAEIYAYAKQIAGAAKTQIWDGFDARNYIRLRNDAEGGSISFSTAPEDSQNEQNFFWKVVDEYFQNHTLEENLSITFHEAFHAFERDAKRAGENWGAENSLLVFEYQESSARNNALFSIESRILQSALESKDRSDLVKKIRQFLAIRKLRQSELDPRFIEFEKGAELNEGLAEYAGTKAVLTGMQAAEQKQIPVSFSEPTSAAFLRKKYEKLASITNVGRNIRLKFYYTGSAQGFLLDRVSPGWKTKVQTGGVSLQDLLETSVGLKKQSAQKIIEAALKQYNYEKILGEEEKTVAQRKAGNQALLDSTLSQKGRRYVIDYSALSQPGGVRNFDPMNVVMITPKMRVHTRMVSFAGGDSYKANFSQPVVEDLEKRRYTTVVPENESQSVSVDGEVLDLSKPTEKRFGSIVITSAKFKLEARAGTIKVANQEVVISLTGNL